MRTIVQYVDSVAGENSPFLQDMRRASRKLCRRISPDFPPPPVLDPKRVRDKLGHIYRSCRLNTGQDIKSFYRHGVSVLDMQIFADKFVPSGGVNGPVHPPRQHEDDTEEEDEEDADSDSDNFLRFKRRSREWSPMGHNRTRAKMMQETEDSEPEDLLADKDWSSARDLILAEADDKTRDFLKDLPGLFLATGVVRQGQALTVAGVTADIKLLQSKVDVAVGALLRDMGFPPNQRLSVDTNQFFSAEMAPLLATIMATVKDSWTDTKAMLDKALSAQTADRLSLSIFMQSVLGAAIHHWVFDFQGLALSQDSQITDIEADLPRHAKDLAKMFDHQMAQILPNRRRASVLTNPVLSLYGGFEKIGTRPEVHTQGDFHRKFPLPLEDQSIRPILSTEWHQKWMQELTGIFGAALYFRGNLAMKTKLEFEFDFPAYMDNFGKDDSRDVVLLGLMPSIKVQQVLKEDEQGNIQRFEGEQMVLGAGLHHGGRVA